MEPKPRILYLLRILEQYTDEEHPLTTKQLIEMLNEKYGISTYRTEDCYIQSSPYSVDSRNIDSRCITCSKRF